MSVIPDEAGAELRRHMDAGKTVYVVVVMNPESDEHDLYAFLRTLEDDPTAGDVAVMVRQ